jgi:respiratory burst oxidase
VQVIAAGIVIGIILHAGTHLACDFPRLVNLPEKIYGLIFLDRDFGKLKPSYMELVKGIEGVTGILMVMLMAVAFILATRWFRRSLIKLPKPFGRLSGFNAFWYSHRPPICRRLCLAYCPWDIPLPGPQVVPQDGIYP